MKRYKKRYMPVNTAQNEHWGMANAPDLGIWAVLVDDKDKLSSIYGSVDQIKAASTTVFSEKIGITAVPKRYSPLQAFAPKMT